ncbi:zf-HC2 domain-containing protein [Actinosynnema sp. NPDC050436]|uniref:zf-HC2 domain-containing protein n=1 Tax=Actinosynnema sp. NPDC050436 TaxID=3155659 RepID=UPI003408C620
MSCVHTVALGAYLLGSLEPAERSAFERHLRGCATCRREVLRLAPLPGLLGQVRLEDLELPFEDPAPDPDLRPLTGPAPGTAAPPRRRWPVPAGVGVLVAGLVVVAGLVAAGVLVLRPAGIAPVTWAAVGGGTGVSARADLVGRTWGTELWLTTAAPRAEVAGWWGGDRGEDERVPGSTSFRLDQIERLDLVADREVLVSVRPP